MFPSRGCPELCVAVCRPSNTTPQVGLCGWPPPCNPRNISSILCKRLLRIVSCLPRFPPIPDSPERRRPSFPLPLPVPLAAENPRPWGPLRGFYSTADSLSHPICCEAQSWLRSPPPPSAIGLSHPSPVHRSLGWDPRRWRPNARRMGTDRSLPVSPSRNGAWGTTCCRPEGLPRTRRPGPSALKFPPPSPAPLFRPRVFFQF
jgi:hypothetical protein